MRILLIVLLFPILSFGQAVVPFGATRTQDTSTTKGNLKALGVLSLPTYATSDTNKVAGFDNKGNVVFRLKGVGVTDTPKLNYVLRKGDTSSYPINFGNGGANQRMVADSTGITQYWNGLYKTRLYPMGSGGNTSGSLILYNEYTAGSVYGLEQYPQPLSAPRTLTWRDKSGSPLLTNDSTIFVTPKTLNDTAAAKTIVAGGGIGKTGTIVYADTANRHTWNKQRFKYDLINHASGRDTGMIFDITSNTSGSSNAWSAIYGNYAGSMTTTTSQNYWMQFQKRGTDVFTVDTFGSVNSRFVIATAGYQLTAGNSITGGAILNFQTAGITASTNTAAQNVPLTITKNNTTNGATFKVFAGASAVDTGLVDGSLAIAGNLNLYTAGKTLSIATGTNACKNTATLSGGTVTVSTTAVLATDLIWFMFTSNTNAGYVAVTTITAGTSFVVTSSNASDARTFTWGIIH